VDTYARESNDHATAKSPSLLAAGTTVGFGNPTRVSKMDALPRSEF
jgi:hypothetical protein